MKIQETRTCREISIPLGYKRTEAGVIPADWSVESLTDIAHFRSGECISVARLSAQSSECWVPVYGGNGIAGYTRNPLVSEPTLVLGRVGQKCGIVYRTKGPAWITDNALYPRWLDRSVNVGYLALSLEQARLNDVRNRNDLPLITQGILRNIKVLCPPLFEQCAITAALSDVDALIEALDAAVAKKRAIKLAAMQQLLTGKTRLPGFGGKWSPVRMGSIGTTYGGLSGKTKADFGHGDASYVTFLNVLENVSVDSSLLEAVDVSPGEFQNSVRTGDILFNGRSETPGDLAMGCVVGTTQPDVYLNSFCFGFRLHHLEEHSPLFVAYTFRADVGRSLMFALAQGATRYNMSKRQFLSLELLLPDFVEQGAIVGVLSDMDAEIAALEQRREKTRAIKQGMMQALLTGRVRLVEPEGT